MNKANRIEAIMFVCEVSPDRAAEMELEYYEPLYHKTLEQFADAVESYWFS